MKRRTRPGRLIAIALCAIIAVLLWRSLPQERQLMQIATPIMSTADFRPRTGNWDELIPYYWLSDHELGYFVNDAADAHRTLIVHNLATGKMDRRFTASINDLPWGEASLMSPDGKRLLWLHGSTSVKRRPVVYALDGSSVISMPAIRGDELTWTSDSRSLAKPESNTGQGGLELLRPEDGSVRPISIAGARVRQLLGFTSQGHAIIATDGVGFEHTFYRSQQGPSGSSPSIQLAEYDLAAPSQPVRRVTIPMPADAEYGHIILSPQGDRLLWSMFARQAMPLQEWLHRLFPSYKPSLNLVIRWQVSRLDGSDMHEIGMIRVSRRNGSYSNPRWLPDGKRISFIHNNTLYTVPAD
jgi:hypothetical protein